MNVRGVNIHYRVIGEKGPWLALITGGRRGFAEFVPLAEKIAAHGVRVLIHDRRNTGASDVVIFDRSIARPRGRILGPFQVSPPATNLNSFNNLASFTRSVKQLITDSPPRCRRGRENRAGRAARGRCPVR